MYHEIRLAATGSSHPMGAAKSTLKKMRDGKQRSLARMQSAANGQEDGTLKSLCLVPCRQILRCQPLA